MTKCESYINFIESSCEESMRYGKNNVFVGIDEDDGMAELYVGKDEIEKFMDTLLQYVISEEEYELCEKIEKLKCRIIKYYENRM